MTQVGNVLPFRHRRRDWRGARVLLSGRVKAETREQAIGLARSTGISVGDLIAALVQRELEAQPHAVVGAGAGNEGARSHDATLPEAHFGTILADPPWRFSNRTGKVAPEHRRLGRYETMSIDDICLLPVPSLAAERSHLYLWVPNALLAEGLEVMGAWGFTYKSNLVWHKVRKDGGSDGRGVGFYFRNVTELLLFGVRGSLRTGPVGRTQVNLIATRKREHSRKPDEMYSVIEACSPGPYLELFARYDRPGWTTWGDEAGSEVTPRGRQYPAYQ